MPRVWASLALAVAVVLPHAAHAAMQPWSRADPALWRWMPHGEDFFEPWRRGLASPAQLGFAEMFAVPGRGLIAYDRRNDRVVYYEGCCSYEMTVLAAVGGPPPTALARASLGGLRTHLGITLGATPADVRRRYGPARLHTSTTSPRLRVLSYYRDHPTTGSTCAWFENFVFRGGVVTEIQAGHAC